jgi:hypothetical protein
MARKTKTRRNPKKAGFPWRKSDDKAVEDGARVERARYYSSVKSAAAEIVKEAGDDEDRVSELISEYADSAVTYTSDAWRIAYISDNTDAIEDMGDPSDWGARDVTDTITKIAYFAYEADLREAL